MGIGSYHGKEELDLKGRILAPGFIDGHLHLESAMVQVGEFARTVIPLGTTTIAADPHEIANVAGIPGIKYLLKDGLRQPWNFLLMLPSSVPSTPFETSGAEIKAHDLALLLKEEGVFGLGEVMDYTGVISGEKEIWDKIAVVGSRFKDGHAPGLLGKRLNTYLMAGIGADHESTTPEEALEKVRKGMYVMIREGSLTRDLNSLLPVVNEKNCSRFFFATDDRHPADLIGEGHINFLVKKAVSQGLAPLKAIRLATINGALALGIDQIGALAPGYRADLVILDNLDNLKIEKVYKDGELVASRGEALFQISDRERFNKNSAIFNSVKIGTLSESSFKFPEGKRFRVIELVSGQLITRQITVTLKDSGRKTDELIEQDLAKLAVVERHRRTGNVGLGLLKGLGLKKGAIASSIAHDCHNIIVAGLDNRDMLCAVREIERLQGGLVVTLNGKVIGSLPLPVAGLLSERTMEMVAQKLNSLRKASQTLGVRREDPFMTLFFMALPVIPELKLTDHGLFDSNRFEIVSILAT